MGAEYGTTRVCTEAMAVLSQGDRQRLAEIERHLAAEDPRFARRMRGRRRQWTRLLVPIVIIVALVALTPLLLITWDRPGVAALGVCAALAAMTWMVGRTAGPRWRRR
jgi:peptidoglycan/LPS O-acetylase OafA/YrhL